MKVLVITPAFHSALGRMVDKGETLTFPEGTPQASWWRKVEDDFVAQPPAEKPKVMDTLSELGRAAHKDKRAQSWKS